jgi:hypothetical protein
MRSVIRDLPILDLRSISTADIGKIERVENVRTVVLNPANAEAFMRVPRTDVRSHLIIKDDEILHIGQIEFNDKFLETLADNTSLVVLGHIFVDGFTPELFFRKIQAMRMYGQVLYSHTKSVGALLSRLERLQGQLLQMPPNSIRWVGATYLDKTLLDSVSGYSIVSIGMLTLDPKVTLNDLTSHLKSMVQIGELKGKEETISAFLAVCNRRLGPCTIA